MTAPHRGLFVAFEGGEGAGKSTQVTHLDLWLRSLRREVVCTREPGAVAVPLCRDIRGLLLDPDRGPVDARAEALLFAADRAQHVATLVEPALAAGHDVITDRYMDSSAAYQGAARGLGHQDVLHLSKWGTCGLLPDLTVVLDLDPAAGRARATTTEFGKADRIENEKAEFMEAVRAAFLGFAAAEPHRYLVVDAARPVEEIACTVRDGVAKILLARDAACPASA